MGDLENLKKLYESDKYILEQKDNFKRTLLHYAVIGEYLDICEFLLKEGINFDEPDSFKTTPLYYATGKVEELLKKYGAYKMVYNTKIFTSINCKFTEKDKIGKIYRNLIEKDLVKKMNLINKNNKLVGKRLIRCSFDNKCSRDWHKVYHGTRYVSIQHILYFGLRNFGEPLIGHIQKGEKINDLNNWASAIFVSPSIFYAKNYSEVISSNGKEWYIIVEAKVKPGSFSSHESTLYNYDYKIGEPNELEYRIEVSKGNDDSFCFGDSDQSDICTTSLLFVQKDFLDSLNNYSDASIFF